MSEQERVQAELDKALAVARQAQSIVQEFIDKNNFIQGRCGPVMARISDAIGSLSMAKREIEQNGL